ncbi:pyridoxal phosphate-dependent aminotransferase family protein [uncultured Psychroserpens sp.]|uniref:aminotransferase class I/II-fold pyridoxal phosphate-dependent enzyme n=1 Tax=uncultured Psychroserpens sp. TaxID=255436 RepID=UPI002616EA7B|nr:pyridoxal phosphate-dependent aminotransferase family protein [uncultured Psychroserpens sp.]
MLPKKLQHKLNKRQEENAFRQLGDVNSLVDFSSNDYLGFSKSKHLFDKSLEILETQKHVQNGATGSRLLSGNHTLYQQVEQQIAAFHNSENALVFNSGYDTNIGFFSCVPQRHDIIIYDEYCHASIRDGITMSHAKAYKFEHNNLKHLEELINQHSEHVSEEDQCIYVVTESVFSMDGDAPDLVTLSQLCQAKYVHLIIDEAHAVGVFGTHGNGLISKHQLEAMVFARIITFGKALGAHGAAILCSNALRDYLINFSRPFIYTTALPPHTLALIKVAYHELQNQLKHTIKLHHNIEFFKSEISKLKLQELFITSDSAIHCCVISGNDKVKQLSNILKDNNFNVKAILSPTVPKGKERLRFCLHAFNTEKEISEVLRILTTFAKTL